MELFNNKNNESLKFKINSEGIDTDKMEARLILTTNENKNYLFIGTLNENICKFDIPELKTYKKGDFGKMKFEIISEDLYFPVWEDSFEIKTKSTVKIEEMISEVNETSKTPIINASVIKEKSEPRLGEEGYKAKPGEKGSSSGGKYGYGVDVHGNDIKEPEYVTLAKLKEIDRKKKEKENELKEEIKNFSSFLDK